MHQYLWFPLYIHQETNPLTDNNMYVLGMQNNYKTLFRTLTGKFHIYLALYFVLWSVLPTIFHNTPHLDIIEHIVLGQSFQFGYWRHPPLVVWLVDIANTLDVYNTLLPFYILSQICIILGIIGVWRCAKIFLDNKQAIFSALTISLCYYYNIISTEFNENILQIPLWIWYFYFLYQIFTRDKLFDSIWYLLVFVLLIYTKYSGFLVLVPTAILLFKYFNFKVFKKIVVVCTISFLLYLPHILWVVDNDFITFKFFLNRSKSLASGIDLSTKFKIILKYLGFVLMPTLVFCIPSIIARLGKNKIKIDTFKLNFLWIYILSPFIICLLLILFFNTQVRTHWVIPFFGLIPVLFFSHFTIINEKCFKFASMCIFLIFVIIFIFSADQRSRTSFNGKQLAEYVDNKYFTKNDGLNKIVVGGFWLSGIISKYSKYKVRVLLDGNLDLSKNVGKALGNSKFICVWGWNGGVNPPEYMQEFCDLDHVDSLDFGKQKIFLSDSLK